MTVTVLDVARPEVKWWHGGPHVKGDLILPASQTGATSAFDLLEGDYASDELTRLARADRVYVISDIRSATMFAAVTQTPWVYQVDPIGDLEPDEDFIEHDDILSRHCPQARILRRLKPSNQDVAFWRRTLRAG